MSYKRGYVVLLPFPFVTKQGVVQKARPALVISDHSVNRRFNDLTLASITSQDPGILMDTEYRIEAGIEAFKLSGLAKTSIVRCEYIMTVPANIVARKIGQLPDETMKQVDEKIRISLGIK